VDAGAAGFGDDATDVVQAREVEFLFRVELAHAARTVRAQHAIGADHREGLAVAHDQVIAVVVELILVQAFRVGQGRQVHRFDEHLVAQALHFAHFFGVLARLRLSLAKLGLASAGMVSSLMHCPLW
jgi:hypothetical protein